MPINVVFGGLDSKIQHSVSSSGECVPDDFNQFSLVCAAAHNISHARSQCASVVRESPGRSQWC